MLATGFGTQQAGISFSRTSANGPPSGRCIGELHCELWFRAHQSINSSMAFGKGGPAWSCQDSGVSGLHATRWLDLEQQKADGRIFHAQTTDFCREQPFPPATQFKSKPRSRAYRQPLGSEVRNAVRRSQRVSLRAPEFKPTTELEGQPRGSFCIFPLPPALSNRIVPYGFRGCHLFTWLASLPNRDHAAEIG